MVVSGRADKIKIFRYGSDIKAMANFIYIKRMNDGWMDRFPFYVLFNNISLYQDDGRMLMKVCGRPHLWFKRIFAFIENRTGTARLESRSLTQ